MRFALVFHPLVKFDLAEAESWYRKIEPVLAVRLLDELESNLAALGDDALLYRARFEDIRRVNPPTFHFGVFYFISGKSVVILGVLHSARDTESELHRRRELYR